MASSEMKAAALIGFVEAIDATGGVVEVEGGLFAPAADPDWIDLGEAYMEAVHALGREPLISAT